MDNKIPKESGFVPILMKIEENWVKIQRVIVIGVFCIMLIFMFAQVIFRFIIKIPLPWSEELVRYAWIVVGFIGSAVAVYENEHIEINILTPFLNKIKDEISKAKITKILDLIRGIVMLSYCSIMSWMCFDFMLKVKKINQLTSALQIPKWWIDAVIWLGFFSMAIHCVFLIIKILFASPLKSEGGEKS